MLGLPRLAQALLSPPQFLACEQTVTTQTRADPDELLGILWGALNSIRYGSVEITIHDGRVVQIERKEKLRLESTPTGKR